MPFETTAIPTNLVITGLPQAGMDEPEVRNLLKMEPTKIVDVSYNSATQVRDIAWLDEKYAATEVRHVDMFPHTHHVENVVLNNLPTSLL